MTTTTSPPTSPHFRRGASLALGGMFVVASTLLVAPIASAVPSSDAVNAIDDRYTTFGGEGSLLGAPSGEATDVDDGAMREYAGGAIYYSKESGAHVMYGAILDRYRALGGPGGELGFPKNDETDSGDGVGRFNDFTEANGDAAAIYWTPDVGAWVIKGKVLEAWRAAGGIKSPFGYPTADTTDIDGTLTNTFVGPGGTQIQWSSAAGLATIPAALAGGIPGFATSAPTAEATTSATKPSTSAPEKPAAEKKGSKWWWWIPIILALLGLLALLPRLFRKPESKPTKVSARAPEVMEIVPPPPPTENLVAPPPPPAENLIVPPPPPRPAPMPPAPPVTKVVAPPPPPRPFAPPPPPRPAMPEPDNLVDRVERNLEGFGDKAERVGDKLGDEVERVGDEIEQFGANLSHRAEDALGRVGPRGEQVEEEVERFVEAPKGMSGEAHSGHESATVIHYETTTPADTTIRITYENNAIGENQESSADKSDMTPDHLQE